MRRSELTMEVTADHIVRSGYGHCIHCNVVGGLCVNGMHRHPFIVGVGHWSEGIEKLTTRHIVSGHLNIDRLDCGWRSAVSAVVVEYWTLAVFVDIEWRTSEVEWVGMTINGRHIGQI